MDCVAVLFKGLEEKIAVIGIYRRPGDRIQKGSIKKIVCKVKEIGRNKCGQDIGIVLAGDLMNCKNTDYLGKVLLEDTEEEGLYE